MQQHFNFGYIDDTPDWSAPMELPNLVGEKVIALDLETFDPHLLDRGPGWDIGDGYICGVSVATSRDDAWYIPVKHEGNGRCFELSSVVRWLNESFTPTTTMVGANLMYDLGWLGHAGFNAQCKLFDVQFAEALLNEHRSGYSLDSLAEQYGYGGKSSDALYKWCANAFGGTVNERQRSNIYRAPVKLVGPYAEADAFLPLLIREQQIPQIDYQELGEVVDLEHRLVPILIAMRKRGVRVDVKARDELSEYIGKRLSKAYAVSCDIAGRVVNVNAARDIASVFDKHGWEYPLLPPTPKELAKAEAKGIVTPPKPSFTKPWLMAQTDNPFAQAVSDLRRLDKLKGTFVDGYFEMAHEGRLHSSLHPLRTGENGTVSGRLSCSSPNTQNIPARDPEFGPRIRGLFIPEPDEQWVSMDYSQIELRFLAHYAVGRGAKETRKQMNEDPTLDFHQIVMDKTGLDRKPAKTVSFSLCIAEDQLVLTNIGLVPIQDVTTKHLVWDGVEWVTHDGVIYKGVSEVVSYYGLVATPDHVVWTEQGQKLTLCEAGKQHSVLMRTGVQCWPHGYGEIFWRGENKEQLVAAGKARVYDIVNAGPRHRFTVSDVLVSNCYGSGVANTAELLGCTKDEAIEFRNKHFDGMPFMKATFDECVHVANTRGHLFTIMGRRARFPFWEANKFRLPDGLQEEGEGLGLFDNREQCVAAVSELIGADLTNTSLVQRARTYKALNSLLQGSAADMMKKAMVDIWESGVCDVLGAPLSVVHDELNWSSPDTKEATEAVNETRHLMANAIKLKVPVTVSHEVGPDWGHLKKQ